MSTFPASLQQYITLFPLPGRYLFPPPDFLTQPAFLSPSQLKVSVVRGRPESGPRFGRILAQACTHLEPGAFSSSRHLQEAPLPHRVPTFQERGKGEGSSCFPGPFHLHPSARLAAPPPTCRERLDIPSRSPGLLLFLVTEFSSSKLEGDISSLIGKFKRPLSHSAASGMCN